GQPFEPRRPARRRAIGRRMGRRMGKPIVHGRTSVVSSLAIITIFQAPARREHVRLTNRSSSARHSYDYRVDNDLRDWLDEEDGRRLPKGEFGVDGWVNDDATVDRVRELG